MAARRTNLTIPEGLYDLAQQTMASKHYESFSEYVAELIRRDAAVSAPHDVTKLAEKGGGYKSPQKGGGSGSTGNVQARNAAAPLPTYSVQRNAVIHPPRTVDQSAPSNSKLKAESGIISP